jgi:putative ABC transport system substrate-binding protein
MDESRRSLLALGAGALSVPVVVFAQREKVRRIAYLANDPDRAGPTFQAFIGAMRELGWVEGTNPEIRYQTSAGRNELFPEIAAQAVAEKVDLIFTTGSPATRAAIAATDRIPIVFGSAANPVEQKFVASLARPGGNVTGLALLVQELGPKRMQFLKGILPGAKRFARFYQASSVAAIQPAIIKVDDAMARELGVSLHHVPVESLDEIEPAFAAAARDGVDALHVTAAPLFVVNRGWIAKLGLRYRLPMMCADSRFAEEGALASYGEIFAARYRRAAFLVDKILRGAKPADIPVEQPSTFELVINMKTAQAMGITIPGSIMLQAERVIR